MTKPPANLTERTYCPNPNCGSGKVEVKTDGALLNWFHCYACGMSEFEPKVKAAMPPKPGEAATAKGSPITDLRLAQLMNLAYHSSSLDDMGDAIIEAVNEVIRLRAREAELLREVESINDQNIGRMGF